MIKMIIRITFVFSFFTPKVLGKAMLTDFKNRPQLEAWLGKKPPDVAVVLAARAAMRVLPIVQGAKREGVPGVLVLPDFRATAFSWAAANYPAHKTEFAAAAAAAYATAVVAASTVAVALATADAAAIRADYNGSPADAYATIAADSAAATRAAATYAEPRTMATVYTAAYADDAAYAAAYADPAITPSLPPTPTPPTMAALPPMPPPPPAPCFGRHYPPMRRIWKKARRRPPSQDRRCGRKVNRTRSNPCGWK
jgi:hypothetical protein